MLKVRGVQFFPSQVEDVIAGVEGLAREAWQIYVDRRDAGFDEVSIAIERLGHAAADATSLERVVVERLRARLGLTVPVRCHAEGALPRYEAKATRVIVRAPTAG